MHDERQSFDDLQTEKDDEWLDEVLRETFPASDPVPWRHRDVEASEASRERSEN